MKPLNPHRICSAFGLALRQAREATVPRTSLSQLSARSKIAMSNISHLERGLGNPTLDTMQRLAEAMESDAVSILKIASHCTVKTSTKRKYITT